MSEHPIEALMKTAMTSIKEMIDVNTVVGAPVEVADGVVIPISRVSLGFAAGGGEYESGGRAALAREGAPVLPFGGGSGAGVSVAPVGFLVIKGQDIRLLPVDASVVFDRLVDRAPELIGRLSTAVRGDGAGRVPEPSEGGEDAFA
jgi:sporulation protein YtfJ